MTPQARHFVEWLTRSANVRGTVCEPCAGNGMLAQELGRSPLVTRVITNDVRPEERADLHLDATDPETYSRLPYTPDWIVTNPPFKDALAVLAAARGGQKRRRVALLLRLTFLEPTIDRVQYLQSDPPTKLVVMPRARFRTDVKGTDSVTVAWMIWDDEPGWYPVRVADRFVIEEGRHG
jgi:hypothetical protein